MDGVYRLIVHRFDDAGARHDRLAGRFVIENGMLTILDDYMGKLHQLFPVGLVTARTKQRIASVDRSGYMQLVREDHVNEGEHPEHVNELDLGELQPEATFMLVGEGIPAPQLVEVWSNAVMVAGKRLSDLEARDLMDKVEAGKLILTPTA